MTLQSRVHGGATEEQREHLQAPAPLLGQVMPGAAVLAEGRKDHERLTCKPSQALPLG